MFDVPTKRHQDVQSCKYVVQLVDTTEIGGELALVKMVNIILSAYNYGSTMKWMAVCWLTIEDNLVGFGHSGSISNPRGHHRLGCFEVCVVWDGRLG